MQQERSHQHGITRARFADLLTALRSQSRAAGIIEDTVSMASRNHAERSVVGRTIVEVQPDRNHRLEDAGRRLHAHNPFLDRPWTVA